MREKQKKKIEALKTGKCNIAVVMLQDYYISGKIIDTKGFHEYNETVKIPPEVFPHANPRNRKIPFPIILM